MRRILAVACLAWFSAVVGGTIAFLDFEFTPGDATIAPAAWPENTRLARAEGIPTLLLFAHAHCPCTHASLDELKLILARAEGRVRAYAIFVQLPGFSDEEMRGESWDKAGRIPGLNRLIDVDGAEARRFGAVTSGYTVVFDQRGQRVFDGGITGSRGQAGVNAGRVAVLDLLQGRTSTAQQSKAYGCAIFDRQDRPGGNGELHQHAGEA